MFFSYYFFLDLYYLYLYITFYSYSIIYLDICFIIHVYNSLFSVKYHAHILK